MASIADTDAADAQWYRRSSDTHGWKWSRVLRETDDCLYVLGSPTLGIACLFGLRGRHLKLSRGPARRLDYFQVAPALRGTGFARQAFAAFARFALDAGASEVVVCSLASQKVVQFYRDIGGLIEHVPGWSPPPGLVPVWIRAGTLEELGARADALEDPE
jgi:GNAT superfamily N-acetyltransferase